MTREIKCHDSSAFKAKVTLAASSTGYMLVDLSAPSNPHSNQMTSWQACLQHHAVEAFDSAAAIQPWLMNMAGLVFIRFMDALWLQYLFAGSFILYVKPQQPSCPIGSTRVHLNDECMRIEGLHLNPHST